MKFHNYLHATIRRHEYIEISREMQNFVPFFEGLEKCPRFHEICFDIQDLNTVDIREFTPFVTNHFSKVKRLKFYPNDNSVLYLEDLEWLSGFENVETLVFDNIDIHGTNPVSSDYRILILSNEVQA